MTEGADHPGVAYYLQSLEEKNGEAYQHWTEREATPKLEKTMKQEVAHL